MEPPLSNLSSGPPDISSVSNSKKFINDACGISTGSGSVHVSSDTTSFSSSLPVLPHERYLNGSDHGCQSSGDASSGLSKLHQGTKGVDYHEVGETQDIENTLPDDDELLAGIADDFDLSGLPGSLEELEEYDVFGTGGMEMESDSQDGLTAGISRLSMSDNVVGNRISNVAFPNGAGTIAGEHPYGEHPSRTLFVRSINSNVEDSELSALFEQYGDIRSMYTACKHRGFVMISYFDIRSARTAMRALQNKPLRRRKLDIHFSIPKDNPSDKDMNQGTLVIFNLDPSVSNEELRKIFGAYGEVKEIRETPHKRHHKFIEFYDVRAAEAALKALNRSEIAGKRIKLEPSRPGGTRRNLMLLSNQEFELDESRSSWQKAGSPIMNSPPGNWMHFSSPVEHNPLRLAPKASGPGTLSSTCSNSLPGLASILQQVPNSMVVPPFGNDQARGGHMENPFSSAYSNPGISYHKSHSLPERRLGQYNRTFPAFGPLASNGSGAETLAGPQYFWGSPKLYAEQPNTSGWPASVRRPFSSAEKDHHLPYSAHDSPFIGLSSHNHLVGSAPSNLPLERRFGFFPDSSETFRSPPAFAARNSGHNDESFMANKGNGFLLGLGVPSTEAGTERGRGKRVEINGSQMDGKQQFQLDLDKIKSGEDARTTLMIKNIPNKYTSKMLLSAIEEKHKGTYDFFYLPIDFKNKCNVGYAFINMRSPADIIPLYEAFNGKKWEKFNSEKICTLAYARIQGKAALVAHFQNSSLMNEDKRCRPILFHLESSEVGNHIIQEHQRSDNLKTLAHQPYGSFSGESPGTRPEG